MDFNERVIDDFRKGEPRPAGMFDLDKLALVTTTGRRSGQPRTSPLVMLDVDGTQVIIASKGGAPDHPVWYLNLLADPRVSVEHWEGGERVSFEATAAEAEGEERERLWSGVVAQAPGFGEYQVRTERRIPVLVLTRS